MANSSSEKVGSEYLNTYEVRLYPNNSYNLLATSAPFVLSPSGPTVAFISAPAVLGSPLAVAWSGIAAPTSFDWVGIYEPGAPDMAYLDWKYLEGLSAGSLSLTLNDTSLIPGNTYEVRLYPNNSYNLLATSAPFVLQDPSAAATTSTLYYVHNDHLGTPQALTDETGAVVWRAAYDPFGQATVNEDVDGDGTAVTFNVRLPGQYHDVETGLHYNYFRYYDPSTGRYLTADPIGLEGGLNTYGYVNGNPLYWVDPFGLDETQWGGPGRGLFDGPRNGNWGGKDWSGGRNPTLPPYGDGPLLPTDSADECYMFHDICYGSCNDLCGENENCKKACDRDLVQCLRGLDSNPRNWPEPPQESRGQST